MLKAKIKQARVFSDRTICAAGSTLWTSLDNELNANLQNILEICTNQISLPVTTDWCLFSLWYCVLTESSLGWFEGDFMPYFALLCFALLNGVFSSSPPFGLSNIPSIFFFSFKGIFSDSNNVFLHLESGDINKESLFPKV